MPIYDKENAEKVIAQLTSCRYEGVGKHNDMPTEMFDPIELATGVQIESEHTNDQCAALNIAKDHLSEIPDYYKRLEIMESKGFWGTIKK